MDEQRHPRIIWISAIRAMLDFSAEQVVGAPKGIVLIVDVYFGSTDDFFSVMRI
jgi:hypothetical protein